MVLTIKSRTHQTKLQPQSSKTLNSTFFHTKISNKTYIHSKTQKKKKKKSKKFSNPRKYKTLTIYLYLSSMRKAGEKITLLHPGKQVPDPQRPDLLRARILLGRVLGLSLGLSLGLLRCRHGLLGPTRLGLLDLLLLLLLLLLVLRRHHHPLLLLRHRLLVLLLRLIRRLGLRDHAGSWLLHHDDDGVFLYE